MVKFNLKEVVNEEDHTKTKLERLEIEKTLEQHQHNKYEISKSDNHIPAKGIKGNKKKEKL